MLNKIFVSALLICACGVSVAENKANDAELMSAQNAYRTAMLDLNNQQGKVEEWQGKVDDLKNRIHQLQSELKTAEQQLEQAQTAQAAAQQNLRVAGDRLDAAWGNRKK